MHLCLWCKILPSKVTVCNDAQTLKATCLENIYLIMMPYLCILVIKHLRFKVVRDQRRGRMWFYVGDNSKISLWEITMMTLQVAALDKNPFQIHLNIYFNLLNFWKWTCTPSTFETVPLSILGISSGEFEVGQPPV